MTAARHIERALSELPPELAGLVRERVRIVVRRRPARAERRLGIGRDWRGAFVGIPFDPPDEPGVGVVFLYTDHIRSDAELEEVLLHELHHFLGADEDDVVAEGLGEHAGLAEVQPL